MKLSWSPEKEFKLVKFLHDPGPLLSSQRWWFIQAAIFTAASAFLGCSCTTQSCKKK